MRPPSIVRFEQLYLGAFALGLLNTVFSWKERAQMLADNPQTAQFAGWLIPITIALSVGITALLWYFTARKASVVAKWIVVVFAAIAALTAIGVLMALIGGADTERGVIDPVAGSGGHVDLGGGDAVQAGREGVVRRVFGRGRVIARGLGIALALLPAVASAQAYKCAIPAGDQAVRPDLASADQPRRVLPIGGYTLAITWAPQYCHDHARDASARFQCGSGNRFGFTLHGLWPDGEGKDWPQYCRATTVLPPAVIRGQLCATPSAQLVQHEWAKHGTCTGDRPAAFFKRSTDLYARLRYPDMDSLSRTRLTAGRFAQAMARANPGLGADMMRITANKNGWLDEVWICLDKRYRYVRCPAHQGGVAPGTAVKIWRGAG